MNRRYFLKKIHKSIIAVGAFSSLSFILSKKDNKTFNVRYEITFPKAKENSIHSQELWERRSVVGRINRSFKKSGQLLENTEYWSDGKLYWDYIHKDKQSYLEWASEARRSKILNLDQVQRFGLSIKKQFV